MTPSPFLTFLAFLTRKLCFEASVNNPRQGLEISPCLRRERLGPRTLVREGAFTASTLRRALAHKSGRSALRSRARARVLLAERT
jgi:hypothetical protein